MVKYKLLCVLLSISYIGLSQNPTTSIATWKNNAAGAYSFIHDDYGDNGVIGINNYADTIARNRNIKFTFGAITSACERNAGMWTQAIDMINYGHEIINHSHNHTCAVWRDWCNEGLWAEPGSQNFGTEMTYSTNSINTNTGIYPRYFIYPYDLFNEAANNHLKTLGYIGSRTGNYEGVDAANFAPDAEGFFRSALIVDVENIAGGIQAVRLNYWADYAANNNVWVNREMHNVGNSGWGHITVANYRDHLNYLRTKINNNELWVGTVSEVLTYQIQKINYTPTTSYNAAAGQINISWNTPSFNVSNYLAPLTYKSPVTLLVNLDGIVGDFTIIQNGTEINEKVVENNVLKFDAYPTNGPIVIQTNACNQFCLVMPLQDKTVTKGENHTFAPTISNITNPVTYSWYFNDQLINGQSGSSLALSNIQVNQAGTYKVVAVSSGTTIESSAVLTVIDREPFNGIALTLPGRLEFEEYDEGGQSISFFDTTPNNNQGGAFRNDGVDIETTTGGGYNIGWTVAGEWLEYTVNVAQQAFYKLDIRHAGQNNAGRIRILANGNTILPDANLPQTGGWQTWSVRRFNNIPLDAGEQTIRIEILTGDVNLDYIDFDLETVTNTHDQHAHEGIEVYPNPFEYNFVINTQGIQLSALRIINMDGTVVSDIPYSGANFVTTGEELTTGIYIIEAIANDKTYRKKLIKK